MTQSTHASIFNFSATASRAITDEGMGSSSAPFNEAPHVATPGLLQARRANHRTGSKPWITYVRNRCVPWSDCVLLFDNGCTIAVRGWTSFLHDKLGVQESLPLCFAMCVMLAQHRHANTVAFDVPGTTIASNCAKLRAPEQPTLMHACPDFNIIGTCSQYILET